MHTKLDPCPAAIFPGVGRCLQLARRRWPLTPYTPIAMLSPLAAVALAAVLAAMAAAQAPACTASSYSSIYTPCTLSTTQPYRNITNLVYFQIQNW